MRFSEDLVVFYTEDPIVTSVAMSTPSHAAKVSVVLSGPFSPRDADKRAQRYRVFLDAEVVAKMNSMIEVAVHACRLSGEWIAKQEAQAWYWQLVSLCLPMRGRCNPLLTAISAVARNHWGQRYWEVAEARDLLRRELSLMGISVPLPTPCSLVHLEHSGQSS